MKISMAFKVIRASERISVSHGGLFERIANAVLLLFLASAMPSRAAPAEQARAPQCAAFQAWQKANAQGTLSSPAQARGIELARERRQELKALMVRDPRSAVSCAISRADRDNLPAEIAAHLERDISGAAYAGPLRAPPLTETNAAPSVSLTVKGEVFRVFLHGNQFARKRWWGAPVKGIALDNMAVLEDDAQDSVEAPPRVVKTRMTHRTYDTGSLKRASKDGFDALEMPGLELMEDEPGTPWLPAETIHVALPSGAELRGFRVVRFAEQKLLDNVVPPPVQPQEHTGTAARKVSPKVEAYARADIQPTEVALLTGDHNRAGHRTVSFRLNPLRYVGATKTVYAVSEVTLEIAYELPLAPPLSSADQIEQARESVRRLVVNPDEVESPATRESLQEAPSPLSETVTPGTGEAPLGAGEVNYLIITDNTLKPSFETLAALRQSHNGFGVQVRTVSSITAAYGGLDTQAKIRACIIDYVTASNTAYVVLGGDNTVVPVRGCYVAAGSYIETAMPTDLYYSGLDSTWDENGNGIYGEGLGCEGIVTPEGDLAYDVIVGRIPVRTTAQANAYIGKMAAYTTNTPCWLRSKFMLAGDTGWNTYSGDGRPSDQVNDGHSQFRDDSHPEVADTEVWVRRVYRDNVQAHGWNAETVGCMFDTLTSWDISRGGDFPTSSVNCQAKYSLGWNFLYHFGHGNTTFVSSEGNFGTSQAAAMTNSTVLFYTCACLSGGFDSGEPSLSEAMLRNANGGALIYLGCSRYGWSGTSPSYAMEWWNQIFLAKRQVAGEAFAEHKLVKAANAGGNGSTRWVQFGLNLQGDPAMNILGLKPLVTVEASDPLASESGSDTGQFLLRRTPAVSNLTVTLSYTGTATLSGTLTDISGALPTSVTFLDGESEKVIAVTPLNDSQVESDETVVLSFVADPAYEFASGSPATVTLVDNDNTATPVLAVVATDARAVEEGGDTACFSFRRTGNCANAVTVNYAVSGTASAADYSPTLGGSLTLPAGQTATNVLVTPVNDSLSEEEETLTLTLQAGAYTIGSPAAATVALANDDPSDGVWNNRSGGSWTSYANWTGSAIACGMDKTANFSALNLLNDATVTLDGVRTIGHLTFGDTTPSRNWTLDTGTAGYLLLSVSSGSSVLTVNNQTATISAMLAGSDPLIKAGAGTLTFTGENSHWGGISVNQGTLLLNAGAFETGIVNGSATVNAGGVLRLSGSGSKFPVTSRDTITVNGGGTLQFVSASTQDAASYLKEVTLSSANGSAASVTSSDGSFARFGYYRQGVISSAGPVANTYAAPLLLVNGGYSLALNAAGGNTLNITGAMNEYSSLKGTPLLLEGAGTVVLSGTKSYTGPTAVNNGTLLVNGTVSASAFTVSDWATLGGTGTLGPVAVNNGGTLAAGDPASNNGIGTLTVASLTLADGARLQVQYGTGSADQVSVTGAVTLPEHAVVHIVQTAGVPLPATLTLLSAGSVTNPPSGNFSGWTLYGAAGTFARVGNSVVLTTSGTGMGNLYSWDVNAVSPGAGGATPYGAWDGVAAHWNTNPTGLAGLFTNTTTSSDNLSFAAGSDATGSYGINLAGGTRTARDVTVRQGFVALSNGTLAITGNLYINEGGLTLGSLLFTALGEADTWTVNAGSGCSLTLAGAATPVLCVSSQTAVIIAPVAGTNGLVKTGAGTLVFQAANTFTGGVTVEGGILDWQYTPHASAGTIRVNAGGMAKFHGTYLNYGYTVPNALAGAGAISVKPTSLSDSTGYVQLGGDLSELTGTVTVDTTLNYAGLSSVTGCDGSRAKWVVNRTGGSFYLSTAAAQTYRLGELSGNGALGAYYLSGTTTWEIGALGTASTYSGLIQNSVWNGIAALRKVGDGTLTLTGAHPYTGSTTVADGSLRIYGSLAAGSAVTVKNGGTLAGTGTVNGAVTLESGATLAPGGDAPGTLTLAGTLALNFGSTFHARLSKTGGVCTADKLSLTGGSGLAFAGTLTAVSALASEAFAEGDTFDLFDRSVGGFTGSFATTNLPTLTDGLGWDLSTLGVDGRIQVARLPCAPPLFAPPGGGSVGEQHVTLSCATVGAMIHYTTDGSKPTTQSPVFSSAITVPVHTTMTIKALAIKDGYVVSAIASATYITTDGAQVSFTDANGLNPASSPYEGGYVVHTFTNSGSATFVVPATAGSLEVDYLLVGGGGSGGSGYGAGGGAGGLLTNAGNTPLTVMAGTHTVSVGSGGEGVSVAGLGKTGTVSSVFGLTALGGGGGGGNSSAGGAGGSGGGASRYSTIPYAGGIATPDQGNDGGHSSSNFYGGGGGGGAGAVGGAMTTSGGAGGVGLQSSLGGTTNWYAAGGSGYGNVTSASLIGGKSQTGQAAGAGAITTGSGGGAHTGYAGSTSGAGGSGIVILRYRYVAEMPLLARVTAPANNAGFYIGTPIMVTALATNGTAPYTVTFYTNANNGAFSQAGEPVTSEPYTLDLGTPPVGTYGIYAVVTTASLSAASPTNTFTVATDNVATGGTITYTDASGLNPRSSQPYDTGYVVHTFTTAGTNTLSIPGVANGSGVEYLIVGGGGSGGNNYGGGGGAGALRTNLGGTPLTLSAGTHAVVVGAGGGGVAGNVAGNPGGASFAFGLKANGGGSGGGANGNVGGGPGGSGGGTSGSSVLSGPGNAGYGNRGGAPVSFTGAGGGGAGSVGGGAANTLGGVGLQSSISGWSTWYAAGGAGVYNATSASGIGGNCQSGQPAGAGVANTGSGGGANTGTGVGSGAGGSGIVILRYPYLSVCVEPVETPPFTWANGNGGSWTVTNNWLNGMVGEGAELPVLFDTLTLAAHTTVTLDGARTVGSLAFADQGDVFNWTLTPGSGGVLTLADAGRPEINVSNRLATLSIVVSGTNGLAKTGDGTLVLHEVNTFSGGVTVSGGTLDWQHNPNASAGTITVNAGATAKFHGTYLNNAYVVANALAGNGAITAKSVASTTYGYISFSGDLSGFTGTFTFDTTLNYGELSVAANADGSGAKWVVNRTAGSYYLSVGQPGTYQLGELSGNGALGAHYSSSVTTWEIGALGTDSTYDGVIRNSIGSGVAALRKVGAGRLTLTQASAYSGGTVVSNGVLEVGVNGNLGTGTVEVTGGKLFLLGSTAIHDSAQLYLPDGSDKLELATGVNETVRELYLNGEPAWQGTWGRIGSTCWHKSAAITGDGILTVTAGPRKNEGTRLLIQ